jgi:hypothetical protein
MIQFPRLCSLALIVSTGFLLASCFEERIGPYDKRSYEDGQEDGVITTCNRIDRHNGSMGTELIEAGICPPRDHLPRSARKALQNSN